MRNEKNEKEVWSAPDSKFQLLVVNRASQTRAIAASPSLGGASEGAVRGERVAKGVVTIQFVCFS